MAKETKKAAAKPKVKKPRPPPYRDNVVGRPPKYTSDMCQRLIDHMAQGNTFDSFAGLINTARSTLYCWKKDHAAFSDAHDQGMAKLEQVVVDRGWAIAMGQVTRTYTKTFVHEGCTFEAEVTEPATCNAAAFTLLAQNSVGWKNKKDVEHSGKDGQPIQTERVTMTHEQKVARLQELQQARKAMGK